MTSARILHATRSDKKGSAGRVMVVLPEAIGRMARGPDGYGIPLPESVAIDVLDGMA